MRNYVSQIDQLSSQLHSKDPCFEFYFANYTSAAGETVKRG